MALFIALPLLLAGYAVLIWKGPWWVDGAHLRTQDLQPADGVVITGFRTTLVALGAGAIAVVGVYYTHRSFRQAEKLFSHTREKDREQADITREGQVTERYVEAIKLLASDNRTQRLGGLYSLERIMRDSEKDYDTVIEVISAFIREETAKLAPSTEPTEEGPVGLREDTQAAITIIGRRIERPEQRPINLRHVNLGGAELPEARLTNISLSMANLKGAILHQADLSEVDLREADLSHANCNGAKLVEARLLSAQLDGTHFIEARMRGARLLDARGDHPCMAKADLTAANLRGAKLTGADFREARLDKASLFDARLPNASFFGASLRGANLWHTDVENSGLILAKLQGADLWGASLIGSDLREANLEGANLASAKLVGVNLDQAVLKDAYLFEADLSEITRCTVEQLLTALIFRSTILPPEFAEDKRIQQRQDACQAVKDESHGDGKKHE
ncbi:pentapeptide repeat-containing protein [Streptomyces sp. NK08203]|uniref:pentapeptide repeat-containing protein n=1 Tax=Streptomyces sp. NK08203 TaxID=2821730 RepID=UPI0027E4C92E|nr:pentapeptide repeat-containing protein [Streptomyces sp. NK08203]